MPERSEDKIAYPDTGTEVVRGKGDNRRRDQLISDRDMLLQLAHARILLEDHASDDVGHDPELDRLVRGEARKIPGLQQRGHGEVEESVRKLLSPADHLAQRTVGGRTLRA